MKRLLRNRIMVELSTGDTTLLRLFIAALSFSAWWMIMFSPELANARWPALRVLGDLNVLKWLFLVHSFGLLRGVITGRFSTITLWVEAGLGVFLWGGNAVFDYMMTRSIGPLSVTLLLALHIAARYPTHNEGPNNGTP